MNTGLRRLHDDDRGTTMIELIVGMAVMVIFMGMFTTAMFLMSNTVNKAGAVANSANQLSDAFLTLDREVRYATGISSPSPVPYWNVEFSSTRVDRSTSPATAVTLCTQLRTYQNQLQQRMWTVNAAGAAVAGTGTDWTPLASSLASRSTVASGGVQPFTTATSAGSGLQQLTVSLAVTATGSSTATSSNTTTFTALNAKSPSGPIDPSTVCQQVAPDAAKP